MLTGTYIGKRPDLYGETVLIREVFGTLVFVQFDNLDKFGRDSREKLALGWHTFDVNDFQIYDAPRENIPPLLRFFFVFFLMAWALAIYYGVKGLVFLFREFF